MDDSYPPVGRKWGGVMFSTVANFWGFQHKLVTSFESPATVVTLYPVQHRNRPAFVQQLCSSESHIINIKGSVELRIWCVHVGSCCVHGDTHCVTQTARRLGRSFWGGSGLPTYWEFSLQLNVHIFPKNTISVDPLIFCVWQWIPFTGQFHDSICDPTQL